MPHVSHVYIMTNKRRGTLYIGVTANLEDAIAREKQMKAWQRSWRVQEIERVNPDWNDLYKLGLW